MFVLFAAAFIVYPLEAMLYKFETNELYVLLMITSCLDIIFLIDVVINFFCGYPIKSSRKVVLDSANITRYKTAPSANVIMNVSVVFKE